MNMEAEKGTLFLLKRQATPAWRGSIEKRRATARSSSMRTPLAVWPETIARRLGRSGLSVSVESQALPGTRVVWMKEEAQSE